MVLRLATGDRVPVDGEIIEGEVWLDEAMLTGEPIPQQKQRGSSPCRYCGTRWYRAISAAVGSQTTLARIIHLFAKHKVVNHKLASLLTVFLPSLCRLCGYRLNFRCNLVLCWACTTDYLRTRYHHNRVNYCVPLCARPCNTNVDYFWRGPSG